jgi:hypothetical protein
MPWEGPPESVMNACNAALDAAGYDLLPTSPTEEDVAERLAKVSGDVATDPTAARCTALDHVSGARIIGRGGTVALP